MTCSTAPSVYIVQLARNPERRETMTQRPQSVEDSIGVESGRSVDGAACCLLCLSLPQPHRLERTTTLKSSEFAPKSMVGFLCTSRPSAWDNVDLGKRVRRSPWRSQLPQPAISWTSAGFQLIRAPRTFKFFRRGITELSCHE